MSKIYFQHLAGSMAGSVNSFNAGDIRVGRNEGNDLRFDPKIDQAVSGAHARIHFSDGQYILEDLRSANGTFLNGKPVDSREFLEDGDQIEFSEDGPKVIFSLQEPSIPQLAALADLAEKQRAILQEFADCEATLIKKAIPNKSSAAKQMRGGRTSFARRDNARVRPSGRTQMSESKTIHEMVRDAAFRAQISEAKGVGRKTGEFFRGLVTEATTHSSKRQRFAMACMVLFFGLVSAGLISSNFIQKQKIRELAERAERLDQANVALLSYSKALGAEGEEVSRVTSEAQTQLLELKNELELRSKEMGEQQRQIEEQAAHLQELRALVDGFNKGGIQSKVRSDGSVSVNLNSIAFGFNSAVLDEQGRIRVKQIAEIILRQSPQREIVVEGHASNEGSVSEQVNEQLSLERAESVALELVRNGIAHRAISTKSFGSSRPIADNNSEEGRKLNRRVEIAIATK